MRFSPPLARAGRRRSLAEAPLRPASSPTPVAMVFGIWCPLGDCKRGGRLFAKGESEQAVRDRLRAHFWNAPAHASLSEDDREAFVLAAEVLEWADDEPEGAATEASAEAEEPPSKRARQQPIGKGVGKAQLLQEHREQQEQKQLQQQQRAEDLQTLTQAVAAGVSIAMGKGSSLPALGSSASSSSMATWAPPEDTVQLPRSVLRAALDSLSRAEQAARQAHMIAAKAAVAFEAEAGAIANAKVMVESLVRHLGR